MHYKQLVLFFFAASCIHAVAQSIVITGNNVICEGQSTALHAEVTGVNIGTTSYNFEIIDYATHPPFSGGTAIDPDFTGCTSGGHDDCWAGGTPPNHDGYDIGFTFCFFNLQYTKFYVGSNGWIGFTDPTGHQWTTYVATPIPNPAPTVPKNCIFAPWQDWYPGASGTGNCVFYYTTGTAPARKLVVYWINTPLYNCQGANQPRGTFMIVLNEETSIIENFLQDKPNCRNDNEGSTQGVHNIDGTVAFTATGRNYQVWEAFNEGTRFVPSGIIWYQDIYPGGPIVGYGPDITVSPTTTTSYFAVIGTCEGGTAIGTITVTVNPTPPDPIITGPSTVCQGITYQYTTQSGMTSYNWTGTTGTITGGGTATDNFVQVQWNTLGPQLVKVTYSSAQNCAAANPGELTVNVTTFEIPVITGVSEICPDMNATFTTQTGMSNYLWVYPGATLVGGGGTTDNSVTLKWTTSGIKTISVNFTDANGCTATSPTSKNITVKPVPNVVPASPSPITICSGTNAQVALSSTVPGTETNTTFAWTASGNATTITPVPSTISGSGNIFQNLANSGNILEPVVFHIMPTAAGCSPPSPTDFTFNVNPVPVVQSSPGTQQEVCSATSTQPITLQTNVTGLIPTYSWTTVCDPGLINCPPASGNSNPIASFTPGNPTATQKTITFSIIASLAATSGSCPGPTAGYIILVDPLPVSTFTGSTTVCQLHPNPYLYPANNGPACSYNWSIIPPSAGSIANATVSPASITWNTPGQATLRLDATTAFGCTTFSTQTINIDPRPDVSITPCFDQVTSRSAKRFLLKGGRPLLTSTPMQGEYLSSPATTALVFDAGNYYFDPTLVPGNQILTFNISYKYTSSQFGCPATSPTSVALTVRGANPPCGASLTDFRDTPPSSYRTAFLAGRCWMMENLRYGSSLTPVTTSQTDNCVVEKYCLPSDVTCTAYGGLYQWDELIQYCVTAGPEYQGVCPPGWHIPTAADYQALIDANQGNSLAGTVLTDLNLNPRGFEALLGGMYYLNTAWAYTSTEVPAGALFWTSTPGSGNKIVTRGMNNKVPSVSLYGTSKNNAFPVRCVKD